MNERASIGFHAPTEPLSINRANTLHWAARDRLLKPWRLIVETYARRMVRRGWKPVPLTIQVTLPFRTNRRRDPHNYTGTVVKAIVDGLVRGGVIPDDTPEWATIMDPVLEVQPKKAHQPLTARVTLTPRS